MVSNQEILIPEYTYHIYNRANGSERLFLSSENYRFFLQKYKEHISPIADTFCYCLMPNHFHFLVRIKPEAELIDFFKERKSIDLNDLSEVNQDIAFPKFQTLEKLLSKQFSNLFSSYTQAFNKQQNRKGSLFMKNFKRKKVSEHSYLLKLVHYIHHNPVESNPSESFYDWPHSSYKTILLNEPGFIKTAEVISWFDNNENFEHFHSRITEIVQS